MLLYSNALADRYLIDIDIGVKLGNALCCRTVACCYTTYKVTIDNGIPHLSFAIG